jgi:hypothetical protein
MGWSSARGNADLNGSRQRTESDMGTRQGNGRTPRSAWKSAAAAHRRADPYLAWGMATQFAYLGGTPRPKIPVIIELNDKITAKGFADAVAGADWITVPDLYRNPPAKLEATTFCTALVSRNVLEDACAEEKQSNARAFWKHVKRFEIALPVMATPAPPAFPQPTDARLLERKPRRTGGDNKVRARQVVGILDDGLAFAHARFRRADGISTRIEYFWDQNAPEGGGFDGGYGRELDRHDIDGLIERSTHGGCVDEDEVYRRAGYIEVRRRHAHGTHVLDLATGEEARKADAAPAIVVVQFQVPGRNLDDTSGLWLSAHALDGLRYIVDRADRVLGGAKQDANRIVVNLSYGFIAGPHDGTSIVESAMDQLLELRSDVSVVIAAGNSYLTRCHASFRPGDGHADKQVRTLHWRVLPDDATPSFVEIWLGRDNDPGHVQIEIVPPSGDADASPRIEQGTLCSFAPGRNPLCTVVYQDQVATGDKLMILVAIAPTMAFDGTRDVAPSGTWQIRIHGAHEKTVDAWVQRDETPYGYPTRGRQSRFDDPAYQRYDRYGRPQVDDNESPIKRAWTLNSIATGSATKVVAAMRLRPMQVPPPSGLPVYDAPAPYSAGGPDAAMVKRDVRTGPNAIAVADGSWARPYVFAAGSRSGSRVAMSGTSVAAPQFVRALIDGARLPHARPTLPRSRAGDFELPPPHPLRDR